MCRVDVAVVGGNSELCHSMLAVSCRHNTERVAVSERDATINNVGNFFREDVVRILVTVVAAVDPFVHTETTEEMSTGFFVVNAELVAVIRVACYTERSVFRDLEPDVIPANAVLNHLGAWVSVDDVEDSIRVAVRRTRAICRAKFLRRMRLSPSSQTRMLVGERRIVPPEVLLRVNDVGMSGFHTVHLSMW